MRLRLGRDLERQIVAALNWMSEVAKEDDRILMNLPKYKRGLYFEFPLRYGDDPRAHKSSAPDSSTFVIQKPRSGFAVDDTWAKVFSAPSVEILEKKSRISGTPPLRWGLTTEQKHAALNVARKTLEKFLETETRPDQKDFGSLSSPLYFMTDVDVALWVDGRLRGSQVIENRPLWEGIVEGAIGASRDRRFKPVDLSDLQRARIQITLMLNPRVPLTNTDKRAGRILPEKGYCLMSGSAKGWYLPEVFNVRRFRTLSDLVENLAQEKAGISVADASKAEVFIFEVNDFIESADHSHALSLRGPVVVENSEFRIPATDSSLAGKQNLELRLKAAADWLCRIQEPDGNMPPIIDPLTGRATQIDWPRLVFTAWALAEFGKTQPENKYMSAARKAFAYAKRFFLDAPRSLPLYDQNLSLAYLGQLAITLKEPHEARACADRISSTAAPPPFEPILFAQISSFLTACAATDRGYLERAKYYATVAYTEFEKARANKAEMVLAAWAELANTFSRLSGATRDESYSDNSRKIAAWLEDQQLPDGAFPTSVKNGFAYSRGTSKILEVLARTGQSDQKAIEKAIEWLAAMQYDTENSFFVSKQVQPVIIGGFRHDYLNQEVWIDAAGHFLLGGAALMHGTSE